MKAILVIDEPKSCDKCRLKTNRFSFTTGKFMLGCKFKGDILTDDFSKRPSWCPLRPMPLKRETQVEWQGIGGVTTHEPSEYDKGWNDCVEFLEGEYDG